MKLTLANSAALNLIRSYAVGELKVGERTLRAPVLVGPRLLREDLRPASPARISETDVQELVAFAPELVIIGWGGGQTFLSAAQRRWFAERQLAVEVMELGAACRSYNVVVSDGREPLALLFPGRDT